MSLGWVLGVIAAVAGSFALGALWYHPRVFGAAWMRLARVTPEAASRAARYRSRAALFECGIVGVLALAIFSLRAQVGYSLLSTLMLVGVVWGGVVFPVLLQDTLRSGRSLALLGVDVGFLFVQFLLLGTLAWFFA